ncbi:hypothetical protein [Lentzea jiangxiensis]|uniref:Uncharacterized protein n=1 Tax=Lentzea jiangxiensis TaxID=641025 RepID=A0A1H0X6B7_9PSEU|nr:hypothetical protein [Lentzea jiangxiensis]SDP98504.1 hypothetical protein SAMN05421507_14020 [Lentzea jiangxiensis]
MSHDRLAAQINLARLNAEHAGRRHAELCIAAASLPIRAHYPSAAALIVGVDDWAVQQRGARLLAVIGPRGTLLWLFDLEDPDEINAVTSPPDMPASAPGPGNSADACWEQLRAEAEDLLSRALRHASPALLQWQPEDDDDGEAGADAFKVELPASLAVPNRQAAAEDTVYTDDQAVRQPCALEASTSLDQYLVQCTTHRVEDTVDAADNETALRRFHCDRGRRWTFLVHRTIDKTDEGLRQLTLTELAAEIRFWLHEDHDRGRKLGTTARQVLSIRRYLTRSCMHALLDVNIIQLSASIALVWVADMDCPVRPPLGLAGEDAHAADGVTYLYAVMDLADSTIAANTSC